MITIQKSFGVQGVADYDTLIRLQELIALSRNQYPVGKAIIDTEKITFYKFGLVVNEQGIIRYCGYMIPEVQDRQVMTDICILFGVKCNF